jgi:hypothetical protein
MPKIFFSYASEDFQIVDSVLKELISKFPDYEPWMDRYEIVGGESLLAKIAEGMDAAIKFFIFLSPVSIHKPWVKLELRRAIIREVQGIDPNFIVPIKIGDLQHLPAFLEDKYYIDLSQLQKAEWLARIDAAIKGMAKGPSRDGTPNVDISILPSHEGNNFARIVFSVRAWEEEFSYGVDTKEDMIEVGIEGGGIFTMVETFREPRNFYTKFASPTIRPGRPLTLRVRFAEGISGVDAVENIVIWQPSVSGFQ